LLCTYSWNSKTSLHIRCNCCGFHSPRSNVLQIRVRMFIYICVHLLPYFSGLRIRVCVCSYVYVIYNTRVCTHIYVCEVYCHVSVVYKYVSVYSYICVCMYRIIHVCMRVYVHMHTHMHVCVYVYIYTCMCMYIYIYMSAAACCLSLRVLTQEI